ncbi:MAG: hypothetical protein A2268_11215 [Candidatus Raymondbacteria bacterium RifOxyA12_full_50_37]|uniref:Glycosyltransferase 2-like domain-containing protein n=1 Tax=Candidatus Raymondbacteria bacterium RIFOXYD12_FULL_49_13 TaxID=1817890 RepID=A0A1F7F7W6_UNCRA|nr:MAG: hypothetical protein A2268_11215 [Candidatus Raymondbacteria bacterium RifOxyA12_full_50_37]OGJ85576.1 MAG: hypothetical protein A2248_13000 [Candidatus Raymondbacteria bacterium RIFOXYA2_FULL_49_16]OGJ92828.1 MAG: hypothetical protein A2350_16950 [Candidatus Raymondbacteria bacterium RifOxyB12_full_50_8]OGJ93163.1 MAG: hypothetical protein A2487_08945 [Candidatus Raymondbacteria bacterium RifOxyC12_full_50_8]OGJ95079.1 MAG: hypothetical protein A2453_07700 [Candidatus Raymondbacteria b
MIQDATMDLSIIIINWKSVAYLEKCVASIFAHTKDLEYEVIVVDNASDDGCCGMLAEKYPRVRCIESSTNLGFSRANNLGYTCAHGKALLFLNPDTEVYGHAIRILYAILMASPAIGIVGGKLLNPDLTMQTTCVLPFPTIMGQVCDSEWIKRIFPSYHSWDAPSSLDHPHGPVEVEAISGACMMVRREVFKAVGLFSQEYFMYVEDVDLCFKARRNGWMTAYIGNARVVHFGGGSSEKNRQGNFASVMMRESNYLFFQKYHSAGYALAYRAIMAMTAAFRMVLLTFALPVSGFARLRKWFGIFRWSLGLEPWAVNLHSRTRE